MGSRLSVAWLPHTMTLETPCCWGCAARSNSMRCVRPPPARMFDASIPTRTLSLHRHVAVDPGTIADRRFHPIDHLIERVRFQCHPHGTLRHLPAKVRVVDDL